MKLDDPAWLDRWAVEHHAPICGTPPWTQEYGSGAEPISSLWCASLSEAFTDRFREGLVLLDYGCGGARFANFMSRRLQDFTYYGVEPAGAIPSTTSTRHGARTNIDLCVEHFGHDSRLRFGAIGTDFERDAIASAHVIIAGSIFTHLAFQEFMDVCEKFRASIIRGADFVFSVFLGESYELHGEGTAHGINGCWPWVQYTPEMIDVASECLGVNVVKRGTFSDGVLEHQILVMSRLEGVRVPLSPPRLVDDGPDDLA